VEVVEDCLYTDITRVSVDDVTGRTRSGGLGGGGRGLSGGLGGGASTQSTLTVAAALHRVLGAKG
jgi:hypothetical protein